MMLAPGAIMNTIVNIDGVLSNGARAQPAKTNCPATKDNISCHPVRVFHAQSAQIIQKRWPTDSKRPQLATQTRVLRRLPACLPSFHSARARTVTHRPFASPRSLRKVSHHRPQNNWPLWLKENLRKHECQSCSSVLGSYK